MPLINLLRNFISTAKDTTKKLWQYNIDKPIFAVCADDIDDDGNVEVVAGAGDNCVHILDSNGKLLWKYCTGGLVRSLFLYEPFPAPLNKGRMQGGYTILAGSSDNFVYAIDANGNLLWKYQTDDEIRGIYSTDVNKDSINEILIVSYDGNLHLLDSSGQLKRKYPLQAKLRCVYATDIDNDGDVEILVGTRDKKLYIFDVSGKNKWVYEADDEVRAITEVKLLAGTGENYLHQKGIVENVRGSSSYILIGLGSGSLYRLSAWNRSEKIFTTKGRIHSEIVADLNSDGSPEIIAGGEKYVYILDHNGKLLWKLDAGGRVRSLSVVDFEKDGELEVIVGSDNNSVIAYKFHLIEGLLDDIVSLSRRMADSNEMLTLTKEESEILTNLQPNEDKETNQIDEQKFETGILDSAFRTGDYKKILEYIPSPAIQHKWRFVADDWVYSIHTCDIDNNRREEILVGSVDGNLSILSPDGELIQRVQNLGWINSIRSDDIDKDGNIEIIIGSDECIFCLNYDGTEKWRFLTTSWVISVFIDDIDDDGNIEIICGSNDGKIYIVSSMGEQKGLIKMSDRVNELVVSDIDCDGKKEIVVGADTRCVNVFTTSGVEKWNYLTRGRVRSVAVTSSSLNKGGVREDSKEVIAGSYDNRIYVIDGSSGNVKWFYEAEDRVRAVISADIDGDSEIEIIAGSEDKNLYILGCDGRLKRKYRAADRIYCLSISNIFHSSGTKQMQILAGLENKSANLFEVLDDTETKNIVSRIWNTIPFKALFETPNRELCIAILQYLYSIFNTEPQTIINYFANYLNHRDKWVRRETAFYLGNLVENQADDILSKIFSNLLYLTKDFEIWIQCESARSITKFIDYQYKNSLEYISILLNYGCTPLIFRYISQFSRNANIRKITSIIHSLLFGDKIEPSVISSNVQNLISALRCSNELLYNNEIATIYSFFLDALRFESLEDIVKSSERIKSFEKDFKTDERLYNIYQRISKGINKIIPIIDALTKYERSFDYADQLFYLANALSSAERGGFGEYELSEPERTIFIQIISVWRELITKEINNLKKRAVIKAVLKTTRALSSDNVALVVELKNQGQSPAENITGRLKPSEQYIIAESEKQITEKTYNQNEPSLTLNSKLSTEIEKTQHIEILSPKESALLEFNIKPLQKDKVKVSFEIIYDDNEQKRKRVDFSDTVDFFQVTAQHKHIPNPYITGLPVTSKEMFYGRKDIFDFINNNLSGVYQDNILVLHGQRRTGKTSILYQLSNYCFDESKIPVLIDMQGMPGVDTAGVLYRIAKNIQSSAQKRKIDIPKPSREDFKDDPFLAFDEMLDFIESSVQKKIVLLFDEIEELGEKINRGEVSPDIFSYFRSLMQHRKLLNFIFTGTQKLSEMSQDYWSVFFNIALHKKISFLSPQDSAKLIREPVSGFLEYDDMAVEKIVRVTAGHPYFIQLISHFLVDHCNNIKSNYASISAVNSVIEEVLDAGESHFSYIWQNSNSEERKLLLTLAQTYNSPQTIEQIENFYKKNNWEFNREEIVSAIKSLENKEVIAKSETEPVAYSHKIELTGRWLKENKAL